MPSPTELDIFSRSLGGDRRARTELFKKYFRENSRVGRLGVGYTDRSEFLHDCFNNLLRTGHSWDKSNSLSQWVESVAVWTALQNDRQRDISSRGDRGDIRMCAEIEGEDVTRGEVLDAYAPPLRGADDSPSARILALFNESDRGVFRKRAMENATWEETAAASGKPVSAVGPIFARVTTRAARLFGAPPPVDDDLLPVFSRASADPGKPEGRAISLQIDNLFYSVTPELQKIGLATSHDMRIVVLWEAAAGTTLPGEALRRHLDQCQYCAELLRALILMHQALLCAPGTAFLLCPGSFTLADAPDMDREAFDQHLTVCPVCRAERTQALDGQAPPVQSSADGTATRGWGVKIAWALAALLVLGLASFGGYRYFAARNAEQAAATTAASGPLTPTVSVDPRFHDLVQVVPMEDARIMASVLPANRAAVKYAIDQFSLNQWSQSLMISSQLAAKGNDPGAQMLYAMSLYRTQLMTDGYREMLKSEAMLPRDSFRCWIMLDFALMVGDRKVMTREAEHLSNDPDYKVQVKKIMDAVKARS